MWHKAIFNRNWRTYSKFWVPSVIEHLFIFIYPLNRRKTLQASYCLVEVFYLVFEFLWFEIIWLNSNFPHAAEFLEKHRSLRHFYCLPVWTEAAQNCNHGTYHFMNNEKNKSFNQTVMSELFIKQVEVIT